MTIEFGFTLTLMFVVALAGGVLALLDGIIRVRRGSTILAVLEIIAAALFVLSLFVSGVPFGTPLLALVLIILLILQLAFAGGTRRSGVAVTLIAIILLVIWLVFGNGVRVEIPGVNA